MLTSLLCILTLASQVALASNKAPVIVDPDWLLKPTGHEVADAYPKIAEIYAIEGRATVSCQVDIEGRLGGCTVVASKPADLGFDAAALSLTSRFQMKPKTISGVPVAGGEVRIPIYFKHPGASEPFELPSLSSMQPTAAHTAAASELAAIIVDDILMNGVTNFVYGKISIAQPGVPPITVLRARGALIEASLAGGPLFKARITEIYSKLYPEADVVEMARFLRTPAGKVYIASIRRPQPASGEVDPAVKREADAFRQTLVGRSFGASLGDLDALIQPVADQIDLDGRRRFCEGFDCSPD